MIKIEQRIAGYIDSLANDELFLGSGSSLFGELFREYINITINPKTPLNKRLSDKINKLLLEKENHNSACDLSASKSYMQLLCFYLSYRNYYDVYKWNGDIAKEISLMPVRDYLESHGCHLGLPGSGNFAMFFAILIYNDTRNPSDSRLDEWFDFMDDSMNEKGLWGSLHNTYQMQNGYHQYEVYNYFNREPRVVIDYTAILKSQDTMGHFGPRIGGGGCYDYDAVSLLCRSDNSNHIRKPLLKLLNSLIIEQNVDGGFCESVYIKSYFTSLWPVLKYTALNFNIPRLKSAIRFLCFYKSFELLETHWSQSHRKFSQSDLWDTWFRLMTIYKIEARLKGIPDRSKVFKFPGIGF